MRVERAWTGSPTLIRWDRLSALAHRRRLGHCGAEGVQRTFAVEPDRRACDLTGSRWNAAEEATRSLDRSKLAAPTWRLRGCQRAAEGTAPAEQTAVEGGGASRGDHKRAHRVIARTRSEASGGFAGGSLAANRAATTGEEEEKRRRPRGDSQ